MAGGRRAIFLDRDGTLCASAPPHEYITSPGDLVILPGVREALDLLRSCGYLLIIASNQRGVARGKMSVDQLVKVTSRLIGLLGGGGERAVFDGVYYCTHDVGCPCRKPEPGLLLSAAADRGIDLASSWMIGDAASDVQAGIAAGCRTGRVGECDPAATVSGATLLEVARRICIEQSDTNPVSGVTQGITHDGELVMWSDRPWTLIIKEKGGES